ncbi:hypothetical protein MTR_7g030040 [Medicago truncatula]|uniref:F-box domain-containing protein n=1 Tax=Medicago truncatula TaxID=3880 RepID=G7L3A9_MEDTR|nr:hypothetical protein MTR_7g030040 [Medicago truncatula]
MNIPQPPPPPPPYVLSARLLILHQPTPPSPNASELLCPPNALELSPPFDPSAMPVILPKELITEILSRLNVKYLMRMKCLSARNPHLALHMDKECAPIRESFARVYFPDPCHKFKYYYFQHFHGIVGSCNGLICLHKFFFSHTSQEHSFCFWNPATRTTNFEALMSPRLHKFYLFGFGYDNSTDTYKMVMLRFYQPCFFLILIWLVRHRYTCHWNNLTIEQFVIISLDLGTETYTQLLLPPCCDKLPPLNTPTLTVLMDCLCFSFRYMLSESSNRDVVPQVFPLCLSEKGGTLILGINSGNQAIIYNWRDNRVKRIKNTNRILWLHSKNYVESLVSTFRK